MNPRYWEIRLETSVWKCVLFKNVMQSEDIEYPRDDLRGELSGNCGLCLLETALFNVYAQEYNMFECLRQHVLELTDLSYLFTRFVDFSASEGKKGGKTTFYRA